MADWKPALYLRFERERTQPSIDLAARIGCDSPRRVLDVGCGPGNSTAVLRGRWPGAEITGLDASGPMLEKARASDAGVAWVLADATGDLSALGAFDVIFSNAAIQWMPGQPALLAKLFAMLNPGGALAAQVPYTEHMPAHTELIKLAARPEWAARFAGFSGAHSVHRAEFYYDILCGLTRNVELWETRYFHVMDDHRGVVEWYRGSGLGPYLDCLADERAKEEFLAEYGALMKAAYPAQKDGRVLFPFTRVFVIARS